MQEKETAGARALRKDMPNMSQDQQGDTAPFTV
jgi:hypothetical protein